MKYFEKYPNAKPFDMVDATIMRSNKSDNCYCCGKITDFKDIGLEAYVCSDECDEALADEFFRHAIKYHN